LEGLSNESYIKSKMRIPGMGQCTSARSMSQMVSIGWIWNPLQRPHWPSSSPTKRGNHHWSPFRCRFPWGGSNPPPYFCAASETIADLANANIHKRFLPHRLDALADTPPPSQSPGELYPINLVPSTPQPPGAPREPPSATRPRKKLAYVDVYVDDFLGLCQGDRRERTRVRRALLYAIDQVLAPLDSDLHPQHNEPASVKKMLKGDACWDTTKVMLGWLIDTVNKTITLPPHRVERLLQIFESLHGKKRVSLNNWHRVVGELRSMVLAIPGGRGLFNALQ
jgi:hypothetical protein